MHGNGRLLFPKSNNEFTNELFYLKDQGVLEFAEHSSRLPMFMISSVSIILVALSKSVQFTSY